MSKHTKIWLIVAAALILLGAILFVGVMSTMGWNFKNLSTVRYETNEYEISETYQSISVLADTADIVFVPSEDGTTSVTCYEEQRMKHAVSVKDGTLLIEHTDTRKWYQYIGISAGSPKITISIPAGAYEALSVKASTGDVTVPQKLGFERVNVSLSTGDAVCYASVSEELKIRTSTGSISVENLSAGSVDLRTSTGAIRVSSLTCTGTIKTAVSTGCTTLSNVTCGSLISSGSTGDLSMSNVIASGSFNIERGTGDVKFERCDAAEIFIETDTGDVKGSLLSEKVFIVDTDTGSKDVPKTVTGGRCEIDTDTGDVKITLVS